MTTTTTSPATKAVRQREFWAEVDDIGRLLDELDDADFDRPTLCDGWAVRDVIGHMCYGHTTGGFEITKGILGYKGNMAKGSFELSKSWAAGRSPEEIRRFYQRELVDGRARRGIAKTIRWDDGLIDHLVHEQDIRRPLGRPRDLPADRMRIALDRAPKVHTPLFSIKKKVAGLRLEATDLDWSWGSGPVVRGPGEALLMAISGRRVALADLSGDGVGLLTTRIAG